MRLLVIYHLTFVIYHLSSLGRQLFFLNDK